MQAVIRKIKTLINKSSLGKGAFYLMGSSSIGHAIAVLTFPILSRIYTPEDIGIWGMFSSMMALVVVSVNLKYEMAIVTEENDEEARALFWFCLAIGVPMALVFSLLFAGMMHFHVLAYQHFSSSSIAILLFAALVASIFQPVWHYYLRQSSYRQLGVIHLSQKVGRLSTQIGLGLCLPGSMGLLLSEALGRLMAIMYALPKISGELIASLKKIQLKQLRALLKKRADFPKLTLPATIIATLASISAVPLLSFYFSAYEAGLYAIVYKILSLPVAILSNTMADVFYNEAAKQRRADARKLSDLFVGTAKKIALFALVPLIGIELVGPLFFRILLGARWAGCGAIAQVLAPWLFMFTLVNSVNRIAIVIDKQYVKLAYDICNFLAVCTGIIAGHQLNFDLFDTLALMSALCVCVNVVFLGLFYSIVRKYSAIQISEVENAYSLSHSDN